MKFNEGPSEGHGDSPESLIMALGNSLESIYKQKERYDRLYDHTLRAISIAESMGGKIAEAAQETKRKVNESEREKKHLKFAQDILALRKSVGKIREAISMGLPVIETLETLTKLASSISDVIEKEYKSLEISFNILMQDINIAETGAKEQSGGSSEGADKFKEAVERAIGSSRVKIQMLPDVVEIMKTTQISMRPDKIILTKDPEYNEIDLYAYGENERIIFYPEKPSSIRMVITEKHGKVIEYIIDSGVFKPESRREL